jgi:hypothetical protein
MVMSERLNELSASLQSGRTLGVLLALLLPVLAGLTACATSKPFSFLDGYRWSRAEINTYDTLIVEVDGTSYSYNTAIRVDPGVHRIVLQTNPVQGFFESPRKTLVLDVEPCTRYWFEAKRVNAGTQDFEPRVNYKEHIAGCGVASSSPYSQNGPQRKTSGGY